MRSSKTRRLLSSELKVMLNDCERASLVRQTSLPEDITSNLLRGGQQVPAGAFIYYFITTYLQWDALCHSQKELLGKPRDRELTRRAEIFRKWLSELDDEKCQPFSRYLHGRAESLHSYSPARVDEEKKVCATYDIAMRLEEAGRLLDEFGPRPNSDLSEAIHIARRDLSEKFDEFLAALDESQKERLSEYLRAWKSCNLSYLLGEDTPHRFDGKLVPQAEPSIASFREFLADVEGEALRANLQRILSFLSRLVAEVDYGNLSSDIWGGISVPRQASRQSRGSIAPFNVIPGDGATSCQPILIAFASGKRGKRAFGSVLRQVRIHLINNPGQTKVVVFFSDSYPNRLTKEDPPELQAYHKTFGVRFLFLEAAPPSTRLKRFPVQYY